MPNKAAVNEYFAALDAEHARSKKEAKGLGVLRFNCTTQAVARNFVLPIPIEVTGSTVEYNFSTALFDIDFEVLYNPKDGGPQEVLKPKQRYNSHLEIVKDTYTTTQPGTLILSWDNTYSWWNTKTLAYTVSLTIPTLKSVEESRALQTLETMRKEAAAVVSAKQRYNDVSLAHAHASRNIAAYEIELATIQQKLELERATALRMEEEALKLTDAIELGELKVEGLGLRALTPKTLVKLLEYGDKSLAQAIVARRWVDVNNPLSPESDKQTQEDGTF